MRAPDVVDQPIRRDDLVGVHEEHTENGAWLASRQREGAVLADRLERSEHIERQPAGHASSLARIFPPPLPAPKLPELVGEHLCGESRVRPGDLADYLAANEGERLRIGLAR